MIRRSCVADSRYVSPSAAAHTSRSHSRPCITYVRIYAECPPVQCEMSDASTVPSSQTDWKFEREKKKKWKIRERGRGSERYMDKEGKEAHSIRRGTHVVRHTACALKRTHTHTSLKGGRACAMELRRGQVLLSGRSGAAADILQSYSIDRQTSHSINEPSSARPGFLERSQPGFPVSGTRLEFVNFPSLRADFLSGSDSEASGSSGRAFFRACPTASGRRGTMQCCERCRKFRRDSTVLVT